MRSMILLTHLAIVIDMVGVPPRWSAACSLCKLQLQYCPREQEIQRRREIPLTTLPFLTNVTARAFTVHGLHIASSELLSHIRPWPSCYLRSRVMTATCQCVSQGVGSVSRVVSAWAKCNGPCNDPPFRTYHDVASSILSFLRPVFHFASLFV